MQQVVEEALEKLLRTPTPVTGAGRTDAGVNARVMPAHFDTDAPIGSPGSFVRSLNSILGRHIAVNGLYEVAPDAHARFDATKRTYRYFATPFKSPFFDSLAWRCSPALDFEAMNSAARVLLSTDDFAAFAKTHTDVKTTLCKVTRAEWSPCGGGAWMFEISADRFLRNMVRAVVGTLVEVGRGKMTAGQFAEVVQSRDRCKAGTSMPAHALYLWDVEYPYLKF